MSTDAILTSRDMMTRALHARRDYGAIELDDDMARTVAVWYQAPDRDSEQITRLAHGLPFDDDRLIAELEDHVALYTGREHAWLPLLLVWAREQWRPITSVFSAYGHHFIGTGQDEQCLTCRALYQLARTPDADSDGAYVTVRGDEPDECTGDTAMIHGYPGEREAVCNYHNDDKCGDGSHPDDAESCQHCDHDCPCIACDS